MRNLFEGITVVDFTSNVAGPMAMALMADYGAEVIKVERAGAGDDFRHIAPIIEGKHGILFTYFNRNKKSFSVDLKDPEGVEAVKKLIARADVVIESWVPGVIAKLGLGYEELKKINPRIIMCSISGYGQTGPYKDRAGYDIIAQGWSGLMDITGEPDGAPQRIGSTIADYTGGLSAFGAICAALYYRSETGEGKYIDISLLDCLFAVNGLVELEAFRGGVTRTGNHHPILVPYGLFKGKKGFIIIGALNPKLWTAVAMTMGQPELADDPRFNTIAARQENRPAMVELIEKWLCTFEDLDEPVNLLIEAGVPSGKVATVKETLIDPQLVARGMVADLPMPDDITTPRSLKARGNPLKISGFTPKRERAPMLGQDNEAVLKKLGYDDAKIAELNTKWVK